jgi:hypothetical protein
MKTINDTPDQRAILAMMERMNMNHAPLSNEGQQGHSDAPAREMSPYERHMVKPKTWPSLEAILTHAPAAVKGLFENLPFSSEDDRQDYLEALKTVAHDMLPSNFFEWLWLRDCAYHEQELRRLRRQKRALIENARTKAIKSLVRCHIESASKKEEEIEREAERIARNWDIDLALRDKYDPLGVDFTPDHIFAEAVALLNKQLEGVEKLLSSSEARRNKAFRELMWKRGGMSRRH